MVRVQIDRVLKTDGGELLQRSMKELRTEAIHRRGYVSGETLRDVSDPRHYVTISTWRSKADWDAWFTSPVRRELERGINSLLAEPEDVTVFEPV